MFVQFPFLPIMTCWGECSFFLLKRMVSTNKHAFLNMSTISRIHKLHKKISYAYRSKFKTRMILKSSFHRTSSGISWNSIQNLKNSLMATSSSGTSGFTKVHFTQIILIVKCPPTASSMNGRLGGST